jgi:Secretion system C-terminal sorting domain
MLIHQSKYVFAFILSLFCNFIFAQRTLYVNGFNTILNSATERTMLLQYAQSHQITQLNLYDLHLVHNEHNLTNAATNQILADFISNAKTNFGIVKMTATAENAWFFQNRIMAYNATRTLATEKFDALGMEFEFWTPIFIQPGGYYCDTYLVPEGLPCDSAGAFVFCKNQLTQMKAMAAASTHPMTTEMYVGWPNAGQLKTIANIVDKTLIHAYVTNPNSAFNYALTRLQLYDTYAGVENVSIIYSAEPDFMGPWLSTNAMLPAEQIFTGQYNNASGAWKSHVNMQAFTYFTYSYMLNIALPLELISFEGKNENGVNYLNWEIANASNVAGFQIEKSLDGIQFDSIGFVAMTSANTYNFEENVANQGSDICYYRLKIVDLNGSFVYSDLIAIEKMSAFSSSNPHIRSQKISTRPNPTSDFVQIDADTPLENQVYEVINSLGQVVLSGVFSSQTIDLQRLNDGVYWLKVDGEILKILKITE